MVNTRLPTYLKPQISITHCMLQVVACWSCESRPSQAYHSSRFLSVMLILSLCPQVEYDGLTGRVEFNSKGQRTNYTLHILEKHKSGHKQVTRVHTSLYTVLILDNGW